jgi:aryl-alcohol dehydrogenase-like predicted oxidoreductase
MAHRKLGRTTIEVAPIGLGFMQFSGGWFGRGLYGTGQGTAPDDVVQAALDGGITFFDTAEMYGRGRSERALAAALGHAAVAPGDVVVATKWMPFPRTARNIQRTIDRRTAALAGYPIDLYQIHLPRSFSTIPAQMRAMAVLQREGRIRAIGVSNFSARQMERASDALRRDGLVLASNQVPISLLDRRIEGNGLLEAARRLGVTLVAYGPLAGGVLTGRFHDDPSRLRTISPMRRWFSGYPYSQAGIARTAPLLAGLREVAEAHGVLPAQVALAWLVTFYGDTVIAIPGASRPAQAEQIAGALRVRLDDEELARLDDLSRRASAA